MGHLCTFRDNRNHGTVNQGERQCTVVDVPRDGRGAHHDQPPEKVNGICGGGIETSRLSNLSSSAGVFSCMSYPAQPVRHERRLRRLPMPQWLLSISI